MIVATSPAGLSLAGVTEATPGVAAIARSADSSCDGARRTRRFGRFGLGSGTFATTSSGPLKPWPKPWASSSYALWVVWLAGSLEASLEPSRSAVAGAAITQHEARRRSRSASGGAARTRSSAATRRPRAAAVGLRRRAPGLPGARARPARLRAPRPAATRAPAIVSSAGSSVSEASITSSTPIEAEIATP